MTRVLEIRLRAPRPNLLQLLAQPEFALVWEGEGAGRSLWRKARAAGCHPARTPRFRSGCEEARREEVWIGGDAASTAVRSFATGDTDLVLGGSFADVPYARRVRLPRGSLRFDPVSGLFGLAPARKSGPLADPELRRLLTQAIDRDALIAALDVPGLVGRATLERDWRGAGPGHAAVDARSDRRAPAGLIAAADRLSAPRNGRRSELPCPKVRAQLLLNRLTADWRFSASSSSARRGAICRLN